MSTTAPAATQPQTIDQIIDRLHSDPGVRAVIPRLEREVRGGELTASLAAQTILDALG